MLGKRHHLPLGNWQEWERQDPSYSARLRNAAPESPFPKPCVPVGCNAPAFSATVQFCFPVYLFVFNSETKQSF